MSKSDFSVKQQVGQGMLWNGGVKAVVQIFTWASTLIVARILNPEDYGLMAIQGVFSGLVILLVDFGVTNGLINAKTVSDALLDGFFYLMTAVGVVFFVGFYLLSPVIASYYEGDKLVDILRVSGILFVIGGVRAVPYALAMRELAYKFQALVEGFSAFVGTATVLVLALNGFGVWSLVFATVANQSVSTLFYIYRFRRVPGWTFPLDEIRGVLRTGGKIVASRFAALVTQRADVFLLGIYAGPAITGFYSMAFTLGGMPLQKVGIIFNQVAFPAFSRLQSDRDGARDLFLKLHKYLLLICVPVLCGGVFVVDELIELVLGDKWMPAALPLKVILGLNILRLSERFVSTAMMGIGKIDAQLYYRIFAMVVMPAAFFVGVQFGVNGLLVSWVIVLPLIYIVVLALIIKYMAINFRDFITSISSVFISSSVMLAGLYIVKRASLDFDAGAIIAINVVVGVFVFIVTLSTFFKPDFRSLINIKSILKR